MKQKPVRNQILVSGGINELYSEEYDFACMRENGSDFLLMSYLHDEKSDFNVRIMEKYNLRAFFFDTVLNSTPIEKMTKEFICEQTAPYRSSPSFIGFGIVDEPPAERFYEIGKRIDALKAVFPDALFHVNLFPWYAYNNDTIFRRYLHGFVNYIDSNNISTDDYPLWQSANGEKYTSANYYRGMNLTACECRDNGREHWAYIYSYSKTAERGFRRLTQNDLFFQAYSCLLFGVSKYAYFCFDVTGFRGKQNLPDAPYCMRNHNRDKTELFDYSKILNRNLHTLSPVFCKYTWQDAASVLCDGKNEAFLKALHPYTDTALTDIHANVGLGVGTFTETDGNGKAFVLMNASEVSENTAAFISLKIPNARKVRLHLSGKTNTLKADKSGTYTLTVPCGMGAFITVNY